ncbi:DUF4230 domain-containing protein [Sphaerisporangium aureirubrum]|uniref:DUF4230 domain-containing protein n=1 Tax=Sphaerisporangium aureirubrum TaxID=1544736 RepID=A0ABW1NHW5_9ACTN
MNRESPPPRTPYPSTEAGAHEQRRSGRGRRFLVGILAVVVLLAGGAWLAWTYFDPFGTRNVDRSPPVLLQSIQDMSRYQAAAGNFQVIVDLEKDAPFLPDALKGSRTLFVGVGSVDAYVDFSGLKDDAITISPDRTEVTVRLPRAQLERPNLDHQKSHVYARERGLFDRFNDMLSDNPADQQELYVLAEQKIAEAAQQSDLRARADKNTKLMLEGMLKSLGFTKVTIKFADEP